MWARVRQEMKVRLTRVEKVNWRHRKSKVGGSFDDAKDGPGDAGASSGVSDEEPAAPAKKED
jgi:hypothetical protein